MNSTDNNNPFNGMSLPDPGKLDHQQELKIPLLSYKKSSRAGLWLLAIPVIFALTVLLKYRLGMSFPAFDVIESFFKYVDGNPVLTYLIPIIFAGLPLAAMVLNLLAFTHYSAVKDRGELLITIKYRWLNIVVFFIAFAVLVYYILPDNLP
jgi:hypothetical protein